LFEKIDVITAVRERSLFGRNADTNEGGGIILVKTLKLILVVTYGAETTYPQAVPLVLKLARDILTL